MFERWLKPVFVFCTQEAAKAIIGIIVMAAVPVSFFMGLFSCQKAKAPTDNVAAVQAAPASATLPAAAKSSPPTVPDRAKADSPRPEPGALPSEAPHREPAPAAPTPANTRQAASYSSVTLMIPTRFRDLHILVDGEPARITDRQLSVIKLQVPRKSSPIRFTLQSSLLSKPREFDLLIDSDNFEYSPFQ